MPDYMICQYFMSCRINCWLDVDLCGWFSDFIRLVLVVLLLPELRPKQYHPPPPRSPDRSYKTLVGVDRSAVRLPVPPLAKRCVSDPCL